MQTNKKTNRMSSKPKIQSRLWQMNGVTTLKKIGKKGTDPSNLGKHFSWLDTLKLKTKITTYK